MSITSYLIRCIIFFVASLLEALKMLFVVFDERITSESEICPRSEPPYFAAVFYEQAFAYKCSCLLRISIIRINVYHTTKGPLWSHSIYIF